jgi:HD-like signal output (HDOD) protein
MLEVILTLVVLLGGIGLWWMRRPEGPAPRARATQHVDFSDTQPVYAGANARVQTLLPQATSQTLAVDNRLVRPETLPAPVRDALLSELRTIPRPPRALHQMLSPEFVGRASSNELADLVMSEPVVAARVMAAVNSPLYGLRKAVTSVGPAITFLGLTTVRNLCVQYLLSENMAPKDPALRAEFDTLWNASAIASELCLHLGKQLRLPDTGSMATQLVLSFVGRQAAAALLQRRQAERAVTRLPDGLGVAQRALAEQERLGLSSGELGAMLMHDWGLPEASITETRGIGRIAFVPAPAPDPMRSARLAVCAISAVLAERIARGELLDLASYRASQDPSDDLRALRQHLTPAAVMQLEEALHAPEMARVLG